MDIHLRIDVTSSFLNSESLGPPYSIDVAVQVERSHTVAELSAALCRHIGLDDRGPIVHPIGLRAERRQPVLVRARSNEVFDPALKLGQITLLSGERLLLADAPSLAADPEPGPGAVTGPGAADVDEASQVEGDPVPVVMVVSGPDVGRSVAITMPIKVGRDRSCGLCLSDPTVSRLHVAVSHEIDGRQSVDQGANEGGLGAIIVPSCEARGPVSVNGSTIEGPTSVVEGDVIRIGATTLAITILQPTPDGQLVDSGSKGPLGRSPFHRTPYYPVLIRERAFDPIGEIPERPEPPRFAYLAALAPLLFGVTMAFLYSPRMLMFAVFSPIVAVAAYVESRRRTSYRFGEGLERYHRKLEDRRAEIAVAFASERQRRHLAAPDLASLAARAVDHSADLWIRDRHAPDHLGLRIGLGDLPPSITIRPETRGDETIRDELEQELASFATIRDVPITIDLSEQSVVALVGSVADTSGLGTAMVLQATCLHSPEDLVVVAAVSPGRELAAWMKWMPHVRSASSPLAGSHLTTTTEAMQGLLMELLAVAEERVDEHDRTIDRRWPRLLVVIDPILKPDPALVSRLLDRCPAAGISVLWFADGNDRVPRQASAVVNCRSLLGAESSTLVHTDPTIDDVAVEIERARFDLADTVARSLASLRDASSATGSTALPRMVTMHNAFGVDALDEDWVVQQWGAGHGYSLPTPIGMSVEGPLMVDLVAHGPHALVGGTSGSGKSELLMAMVAGLIAFNPPTKVNVLFVDYKGGASSDIFRSAPHTVGYVTNLDALLARRALTSLRAELNRRMNLLQGRAKDLAEMIERHPDEAPPSLVIVVDEFATLAKEVPDFVAGVVDIAQRGRSLGIHLILATQRPSGAVNDNILANTNLRISLRMLDGAESNSVIGTNDAATIPTPLKGRAFARVGPGQLVAFQSAWTGAPCSRAKGPPPIVIERFDPEDGGGCGGAGSAGRAAQTTLAVHDTISPGPTQLEALLGAVRSAAVGQGLGAGPSPWQDELPAKVDLATVLAEVGDRAAAKPQAVHESTEPAPTGWTVTIGLIDDPDAQAQYPAVVDLVRDGPLAVFGTGGSGKTTALRTVALSSAIADSRRGGGCLTIFGLDFASRQLASLANLPQCSAVASGDDMEAVTRIIGLLDGLLDRRRDQLATAVRQGDPAPVFSRVLLLIDDYGNLAQGFEGSGANAALYGWLETLNRVVADGRQVGIHTALTATRRAVVKAALLSAISNRIVLRQADSGGYAELGLPSSLIGDLELPPGRGFYNGSNLVQLAVVDDEADAITGLRGSVDTDLITKPLPVHVEALEPSGEPMVVPVGLADMSSLTVAVDLRVNNLTIVGDPQSGRSNALGSIGQQLCASGQPVWAIGPATSPLAAVTHHDRAAFGPVANVLPLLEELGDELDTLAAAASKPLLLIDDVDLLDEAGLEPAMARLCSLGLRWVASTTSLQGYSSNQLIQDMKKARSFLHLRPLGVREVQEITGCRPELRPGLSMPPGRAVLVQNRTSIVVQIARTRCGPELD